MDTMAEAFGLPIGYSDHTLGADVAVAAVARGAVVIEKHFTLDRSLDGPDHAASLEPTELRSMIASIRIVERALGEKTKCPAPGEFENRDAARRSVVAACRIRRGESLTLEMLDVKRPGSGISPMETWSLLGRRANQDYEKDEPLIP
jgi:N-acetylneuraminate synthase